jgi:RNA polymerase sigma factor (sigma-70 family)
MTGVTQSRQERSDVADTPERHPKTSPPITSQTTLVELTRRAMDGDDDAFAHLHRRVGAGVRRLLMKRSAGREDLVDDLCQRTWQSTFAALRDGKYDPARSAITTFVYAIANNAWLTHLRVYAREHGYSGSGLSVREAMPKIDPRTTTAAPADAAAQAELLEHVRACLSENSPAGLTEHERYVVRAIAAGESDRGLARRMGVSSSTVNIRKHSGYEKLRAYLRTVGGDALASMFEDDDGNEDDSRTSAGRAG